MKENNSVVVMATINNSKGESRNICIIMPHCQNVLRITRKIEHMLNAEVVDILMYDAECVIHLSRDIGKEI